MLFSLFNERVSRHQGSGHDNGSQTIISAADEQITATTDENILLEGTGDTLSGSGYRVSTDAALTVTLGGAGKTSAEIDFFGSDDTITVADGANVKLRGSNDTITSNGSLALTVRGSHDTIAAVAGDVIGLLCGSSDTVSGVGITVNAAHTQSLTLSGGGQGSVGFVGAENSLTLAAGVNLNLTGNENKVSATLDDVITLQSGKGDLFIGGEFTIDAAAGESFGVTSKLQSASAASGLITVDGSGFSLGVAAGSNVALIGSQVNVNATKDDVIDLLSGSDDSFAGGNFTVDATAGTSFSVEGGGNGHGKDSGHGHGGGGNGGHGGGGGNGGGGNGGHGGGGGSPITVNGSTITLAVLAGSTVNLNGSTDTVTLAKNSSLTVVGSGDSVSLAGRDTLVAGLNTAVADLGSANNIAVTGNVGALTITGFGSDARGVVSLGAGVGGFANVAAVVSALTSDGNGGTLLSLGADGSIDFVGVAASSLGASHFAIG
jgi:hypothetical protein